MPKNLRTKSDRPKQSQTTEEREEYCRKATEKAYNNCSQEAKDFINVLKQILKENLHAKSPSVNNPFDETPEEIEERKGLVAYLLAKRMSSEAETADSSYIRQYMQSGYDCINHGHLIPEYWMSLTLLRSLRKNHELINLLPLGSKDRYIAEQELFRFDFGLGENPPIGYTTNRDEIAAGLGCNSGGKDGLLTFGGLHPYAASFVYDQFALVKLRDFNRFLQEKVEDMKNQPVQSNSSLDLRVFIRSSLEATNALLNSGYPDDHHFLVRRFGESGAKEPFTRVLHQLKKEGGRYVPQSSVQGTTDAVLEMICPLIIDWRTRYVGIAPFGNNNAYRMEAAMSIHRQGSSLFHSAYANVTCGGTRLLNAFWPYNMKGDFDVNCQSLSAVRSLILKHGVMYFQSSSVTAHVQAIQSVSSRLAVAVTEVVASVVNGHLNGKSIVHLNEQGRKCFSNQGENINVTGPPVFTFLGVLYALFGDDLRPKQYPDLLQVKAPLSIVERTELINSFVIHLMELGVVTNLLELASSLFTHATPAEALSIRNDMTLAQSTFGSGLFTSLPEGGRPGTNGMTKSAGQVDLMSYPVGVPSLPAGGEGERRTIFTIHGVPSMTHAAMVLANLPIDGHGPASMREMLTLMSMSPVAFKEGNKDAQDAQVAGQKLFGALIDGGGLIVDTCHTHNGEIEDICGDAPTAIEREKNTLFNILRLTKHSGVKSMVVRSDRNSEVVGAIFTDKSTCGVGTDAVCFRTKWVTDKMRLYLVKLVGVNLSETNAVSRVRIQLVVATLADKSVKAFLVYYDVLHPSHQFNYLQQKCLDSSVEYFVKFGLPEFLFGGGALFNFLCGDVPTTPASTGLGEFFMNGREPNYTSPSPLALLFTQWMRSNGGLRGGSSDLLEKKALCLLTRAQEGRVDSVIVRAKEFLAHAQAGRARISGDKARGGKFEECQILRHVFVLSSIR